MMHILTLSGLLGLLMATATSAGPLGINPQEYEAAVEQSRAHSPPGGNRKLERSRWAPAAAPNSAAGEGERRLTLMERPSPGIREDWWNMPHEPVIDEEYVGGKREDSA